MKAMSEIEQIRAVRKDLAAKCHNDLASLADLIRQREEIARQSGRRIMTSPDEMVAAGRQESVLTPR